MNTLNKLTEATLFPAALQKDERLLNLSKAYDDESPENNCFMIVSFILVAIAFQFDNLLK